MGIKLSKTDKAFIADLPIGRLATATEDCAVFLQPELKQHAAAAARRFAQASTLCSQDSQTSSSWAA